PAATASATNRTTFLRTRAVIVVLPLPSARAASCPSTSRLRCLANPLDHLHPHERKSPSRVGLPCSSRMKEARKALNLSALSQAVTTRILRTDSRPRAPSLD